MLQLDDARASRGDEGVFGRGEDSVQQDQKADGEELEKERHAPTPWAWVLGGMSSSNWRSSIGNGPVGSGALGAALADEPLEVGERLGHGESPLRRGQIVAEKSQRDLE